MVNPAELERVESIDAGDGIVCVESMRPPGHEGPAPYAVKWWRQPVGLELDARRASLETARLLGRAERQRLAAEIASESTGGGGWVRVLNATRAGPDSVAVVYDRWESSLDQTLRAKALVADHVVRAILLGIARGLVCLEQLDGAPHGTISARNVLLRRDARGAFEAALNDPLPEREARALRADVDLEAVAELLGRLVTGEPGAAARVGATPGPEWTRDRTVGEAWATIARDLLDHGSETAIGDPRTLLERVEAVRVARPSRGRRRTGILVAVALLAIATTVGALVLRGAGGPPPELDQWGRLSLVIHDDGGGWLGAFDDVWKAEATDAERAWIAEALALGFDEGAGAGGAVLVVGRTDLRTVYGDEIADGYARTRLDPDSFEQFYLEATPERQATIAAVSEAVGALWPRLEGLATRLREQGAALERLLGATSRDAASLASLADDVAPPTRGEEAARMEARARAILAAARFERGVASLGDDGLARLASRRDALAADVAALGLDAAAVTAALPPLAGDEDLAASVARWEAALVALAAWAEANVPGDDAAVSWDPAGDAGFQAALGPTLDGAVAGRIETDAVADRLGDWASATPGDADLESLLEGELEAPIAEIDEKLEGLHEEWLALLDGALETKAGEAPPPDALPDLLVHVRRAVEPGPALERAQAWVIDDARGPLHEAIADDLLEASKGRAGAMAVLMRDTPRLERLPSVSALRAAIAELDAQASGLGETAWIERADALRAAAGAADATALDEARADRWEDVEWFRRAPRAERRDFEDRFDAASEAAARTRDLLAATIGRLPGETPAGAASWIASNVEALETGVFTARLESRLDDVALAEAEAAVSAAADRAIVADLLLRRGLRPDVALTAADRAAVAAAGLDAPDDLGGLHDAFARERDELAGGPYAVVAAHPALTRLAGHLELVVADVRPGGERERLAALERAADPDGPGYASAAVRGLALAVDLAGTDDRATSVARLDDWAEACRAHATTLADREDPWLDELRGALGTRLGAVRAEADRAGADALEVLDAGIAAVRDGLRWLEPIEVAGVSHDGVEDALRVLAPSDLRRAIAAGPRTAVAAFLVDVARRGEAAVPDEGLPTAAQARVRRAVALLDALPDSTLLADLRGVEAAPAAGAGGTAVDLPRDAGASIVQRVGDDADGTRWPTVTFDVSVPGRATPLARIRFLPVDPVRDASRSGPGRYLMATEMSVAMMQALERIDPTRRSSLRFPTELGDEASPHWELDARQRLIARRPGFAGPGFEGVEGRPGYVGRAKAGVTLVGDAYADPSALPMNWIALRDVEAFVGTVAEATGLALELPTARDWRRVVASGPDRQATDWNLLDETLLQDDNVRSISFGVQKELNRMPQDEWLDDGLAGRWNSQFVDESSAEDRRRAIRRELVATDRDGSAFVRETPAPRETDERFHDLIGNVAEFIRTDDGTGVIAGGGSAVTSASQTPRSLDELATHLAGREVLSTRGLARHNVRRPYYDVGFRLALDLDESALYPVLSAVLEVLAREAA